MVANNAELGCLPLNFRVRRPFRVLRLRASPPPTWNQGALPKNDLARRALGRRMERKGNESVKG